MTPSSLEGLSPQEAAASGIEYALNQCLVRFPQEARSTLIDKAAELRAHKTPAQSHWGRIMDGAYKPAWWPDEKAATPAQAGTYWLIERGSPAEYYVSGHTPNIEWTTDFALATRFATEATANHQIYGCISSAEAMQTPVRVCKHMDVSGPSEWERECADTDELLRLIGLDPEACRTDGGSLNMARIRHLLKLAQEPVAIIHSDGYWTRIGSKDPFPFGCNHAKLTVYTRPAAMSEALGLLKEAEEFAPMSPSLRQRIAAFLAKHGGEHE